MRLFTQLAGILVLLATCCACTSVGEVKEYQDKLHRDPHVFADELAAVRSAAEKCTPAQVNSQFELAITDGDPVVVQSKEDGIFANFQVRCISSDGFPEYLRLDAQTYSEAKGYGKVFYFMPKVVVYDESLKVVTDKPQYQNEIVETFSAYFLTQWKLQPRHAKKLILLIEADNRNAGLPLGASSGNPVLRLYTWPTGKAQFKIEAVK